jgi:hypothetical protein
MAETPFAQVGLLLVAVNWTGEVTVDPLTGLDTETVAPRAQLESRRVTPKA